MCEHAFSSYNGVTPRYLLSAVNLPPLRPREGDKPKQSLRRVLIDIRELDRFVDAHKTENRRAIAQLEAEGR